LSAGALPQTPLGELAALPRPLAVFRGLLLKVEEGRGGEGKVEERGREEGVSAL